MMKTTKMAGYSVVEMIVALSILSFIIVSLYQGLNAGDRIRGRAHVTKTVSMLALNEAERVRNIALDNIVVGDTNYTETIRGLTYTVQRESVKSEMFDQSSSGPVEIHIIITPQSEKFPPYTFKLIQGGPN